MVVRSPLVPLFSGPLTRLKPLNHPQDMASLASPTAIHPSKEGSPHLQPSYGAVALRFGANPYTAQDTELAALLRQKGPVSVDGVKRLIQAGANPNRTRALEEAIFNNHLAVAEYLISEKDTLEISLTGSHPNYSPIHCAIYKGHTEIARKLIEAGTNVNAFSSVYGSPLAAAAAAGNEALFDFILEHGGNYKNVDSSGGNMLVQAVKGENVQILKKLLALGLDPNAKPKDYIDTSLVAEAVATGRWDLVEALADAGANLNVTFYGEQKFNPLHMLSEIGAGRENQDNLDRIVKRLVAAGVGIDQRDNLGETPLAKACQQESYTMMQVLLDNGANINAYNGQGYRMLDRALHILKTCQRLVISPTDLGRQKQLKEAQTLVNFLKARGAKKGSRLHPARIKEIALTPYYWLHFFLYRPRG